jgi:hypothetical protein
MIKFIKVNTIDLPKKDSRGVSRTSYSEIACFLKSKKEYYKRYILNEKFIGNWYTRFGSKVGNAIEKDDYSLFTLKEQEVLKKCVRLDSFERRINIDFGGFYLKGFIDTISNDFETIIDYKTGSTGKESKYESLNYTQLHYYSLGIYQETGILPRNGYVNYINRKGNAFKGEKLTVDLVDPVLVKVDLSIESLQETYHNLLNIVNDMSEFYKNNKLTENPIQGSIFDIN